MNYPPKTLFCKFNPHIFGDLQIKGETIPLANDYYYQNILEVDAEDTGEFINKIDDSIKNQTSFNLDFDCQCRDGLFEKDQLFAIWENEDIGGLINILYKTL